MIVADNITITNTHEAPKPVEAPEQPKPSLLSKLAGPALIGASLLGTGGIGAAAYIGGKLLEKPLTTVIEQPKPDPKTFNDSSTELSIFPE